MQKLVNGTLIDLTADEIAEREQAAEEALAAKPAHDWLALMESTDKDLPRWAEDLIDGLGGGAILKAQPLIDKYNAKKEARAAKP